MVAAWNQNRREEAIRLYQSGMTLVEVCRCMQAGSPVVQKYLKAAGVKLRSAARRGWSPERIRRLIVLYRSGRSIKECARLLGTGVVQVGKYLRLAGCPPRSVAWTPERLKQALMLYRQGHSVAETARRVGTNTPTLRRYLRKAGVRIRPHAEATCRGEQHGNWNNEPRRAVPGDYVYVYAPQHPQARGGRVPEHRLVMERYLGRYLTREEVVHHKNKNKHDNRLENLQLFATNGEHLAFELKGQTPKWTEDGKRRLAEAARARSPQKCTPPRPTGGDRQ